jgi:hypothetical protein
MTFRAALLIAVLNPLVNPYRKLPGILSSQ